MNGLDEGEERDRARDRGGDDEPPSAAEKEFDDVEAEVDSAIPICDDCGGILVPGYEHTHHCNARKE